MLATIVGQDPMHVTCRVSVPTALHLRTRYADKGGFEALSIKLLLPDRRIYGQEGRLGFVDIDVGQDTDTTSMRGTIPNPILPGGAGGNGRLRELTNGEYAACQPRLQVDRSGASGPILLRGFLSRSNAVQSEVTR